MSNLMLRYYAQTIAYQPIERERRIRELKRDFTTRLSRRRVRQLFRLFLARLHDRT